MRRLRDRPATTCGTNLRQAIFDPGYRAHRRYFDEAGSRLTIGGRLLLGFSDIGDHSLLQRVAAEAGFRISVLCSSGDLVPGVDYQLLELVPDDRREILK